jgi:acyl-CoA thioesterase-1
MKRRWLALVPALLAGRALRVRLSVGPRRRYWQRQAASGEVLLVALGDSLTQGIGSSRPARSWLGRYRAHLQAVTGRTVRVDNRAVYGARLADLLATQLPLPDDADFVTVCIGSNDAGRTPPDRFADDLRALCRQLPPGTIVGDVPEFQWGPRIAAAAELSAVVRSVVADFPQLELAEVEGHTVGTRILTELAGDFFHPADRGYRRITRAFVAASGPRLVHASAGPLSREQAREGHQAR